MTPRDREKDMRVLARLFFEHLQNDGQGKFSSWGRNAARPGSVFDISRNLLLELGVIPEDTHYSDTQLAYARELFRDIVPWLKKFGLAALNTPAAKPQVAPTPPQPPSNSELADEVVERVLKGASKTVHNVRKSLERLERNIAKRRGR